MQGLLRTFFVLLAVFEVYTLLPPRFTNTPATELASAAKARIGAIHVRSPDPLTHESLESLTTTAKERGIDFIVIADPKSSHARSVGLEGTYDGVDVYVEMEAHLTAGHAVVFYSHTSARELSDEAVSRLAWRHFLGTDPQPGMFLVVAHPDSQTTPWARLDKFSEGMEIFNVDTLWRNQQEAAPASLLLSSMLFPVSNYLSALRTVQVPEKNLQAWDAINSLSPGHFAIAAQELPSQSGLPRWMPNGWSLALSFLPTTLNAVAIQQPLATTFEARRLQTYEALSQGKTALFFPLRYPRFASDWRLVCGEHTFRAGSVVPSALSNCNFQIELDPALAKLSPSIRLLRDGKLVTQWERSSQPMLQLPLVAENAGAYRLEIGIPTRTPFGILVHQEVPYAFYNPIYVR